MLLVLERPMLGYFWRRRFSTASRILQDTLGFRGVRNLASWGVAGAAAYYLWVLPEQRQQQDHKVSNGVKGKCVCVNVSEGNVWELGWD